MTATQAPPLGSEADSSPRVEVATRGGLASVLASADHKVVGRLYIGTALLFGLASGVAGILGAIDRVDGLIGNTILDPETAGQVLSFHNTSLPLLALMPALLGLAMVVVPLQVGARAIAFPRAAAASYWTFLLGSSLVIASYAMNGGPGGGRTDAVDLWFAAMGLVAASLTLGSICVATTILAGRAEGMTVDHVPLFAWSMLCTTTVWLVTLPVLGGLLIIMFLDHRHGQIFIETGPETAYYFDWLRRPPQIFALAIPALGLVLDTAATTSRAPVQKRGAARFAIGAFAVLSIGFFTLPKISSAGADQPLSDAMALLAPLPVLVVLGLTGLTIKNGRPGVSSGLVGAGMATLVLLLATALGVLTPFQSAFELQGTQWTTAQMHLTLAASVLTLIAGLYYWSTKVLGRAGGEGMGRTAPVLLGIGALAIGVAEAISGLLGTSEEAGIGIKGLNIVAVVGGGLILLGGLVAVAGLVGRRRADETGDPWGGQTLEWATASPPSFVNFDGDIPPVGSPEPLLAPAGAAAGDEGES